MRYHRNEEELAKEISKASQQGQRRIREHYPRSQAEAYEQGRNNPLGRCYWVTGQKLGINKVEVIGNLKEDSFSVTMEVSKGNRFKGK